MIGHIFLALGQSFIISLLCIILYIAIKLKWQEWQEKKTKEKKDGKS